MFGLAKMPAIDPFDFCRRSADGCLCCGRANLRHETQLISGFLAQRAWGGKPETTRLAHCDACGFRFFERGLNDVEAERYYRGYRDAEYVRSRRCWEPFYTRTQHTVQVAWSRSAQRTDALRKALAQSSAPSHFGCVLDHGGNEGHMLAGVTADRKAVFDPSGCPTLPGIGRYAEADNLPSGWDLILSCQVLEHISSPAGYLHQMAALLGDQGWLYIEVPSETWRPASEAGRLRNAFLRWLIRWRPLLIAADVICTVSRIKFGRLPPLGFVAMREHLNYFSIEALTALLSNSGFSIDSSGINDAGQIYAVARKLRSTEASLGGTAKPVT